MDDHVHELRARYRSELSKVDGIEVQALPLHPYMATGIKMKEFPVLLQVAVGDFSNQVKREPLHVCLVLDRSGSMSGRPLYESKEAVINVMEQLDSDDVVSFITYDSEVQTVFANESVADSVRLSAMVRAVCVGGTTNISDALERAVQVLSRATKPGEHKRVVFLFSDGQANCGITDLDTLGTRLAQQVVEHDIQISTFGIGANFNETWMRSMARCGKGNYFFIQDSSQIPDLVERGLSGYTQVLAREVRLAVRGLNGNAVCEVQSASDTETLLHGYRMGNLRSLGLYQVLVKMELNANPFPHGETEGTVPLMEYCLSFSPVDNSMGPECNMSGRAGLTYTNDAGKLQEKNSDAVCYMAVTDCVPLEHQVDEALRERRVTDALKAKKEVVKRYEAVQHNDRFGIVASALARARKVVAMLEQEGASQAAQKYQGLTTAFAYAATKTVAKEAWEAAEEEDEDMGFGLYD